MTGAVAAVVEVNSFASIVIFVDRIVEPASLISNVGKPEVEAVVSDARTAVNVIANGIRNVTLAVPVVIVVVSSEIGITITSC